jgi:hypothetical protein
MHYVVVTNPALDLGSARYLLSNHFAAPRIKLADSVHFASGLMDVPIGYRQQQAILGGGLFA